MEGDLEKKAKRVRKYWFDNLEEEKQDTIIKPHFDKEHPTSEKIKERVKEYDGA